MGESKTTKRCRVCAVVKGLGSFYKNKTYRDGYGSICNECAKKRSRDHHKAHRVKILKYQHKYRADHKVELAICAHKRYNVDKVQILKQHAQYRAQNRSAIRIRNRKQTKKYRETHKNQKAILQQKYHSTPAGKLARKRGDHKRRAREKNTKATLTANQWGKILSMQHNCCNMCRKQFTIKRPPTTDHIIPLSAGGGLTFENVQALCGSCNSSKQAKLDPQFIQTWL